MDHDMLASLVERVKQGDDNAFAAIYELFFKKVYYLAFRMLKNREDAQDVAQDMMIKLGKNLHSIQNPKALTTYINKAATTQELRQQTLMVLPQNFS